MFDRVISVGKAKKANRITFPFLLYAQGFVRGLGLLRICIDISIVFLRFIFSCGLNRLSSRRKRFTEILWKILPGRNTKRIFGNIIETFDVFLEFCFLINFVLFVLDLKTGGEMRCELIP